MKIRDWIREAKRGKSTSDNDSPHLLHLVLGQELGLAGPGQGGWWWDRGRRCKQVTPGLHAGWRVWCKGKLLKALHTWEIPVSASWRTNRSGEEWTCGGSPVGGSDNGALLYPKALLPFLLTRIPILFKSEDVILRFQEGRGGEGCATQFWPHIKGKLRRWLLGRHVLLIGLGCLRTCQASCLPGQ